MSLALCLLLCVLVSASAAVFRARAHSAAARATFLFIIGASGAIPVLVFAWRAPAHAAERIRVLGREWYDASPFVASGLTGVRGDLAVTRPVVLTLLSAGATVTVQADSAPEADAVRVNGVPLNGILRDANKADSLMLRASGSQALLVMHWKAIRLAGRCSESSIGRWQRLTGIRACALGLTTTASGSTRQDTLVAGSTKVITVGATRIRIQLESVKRRISVFVDPSRVSDIGGVNPARAAVADSVTIDRAEVMRVSGAEGHRRVSIEGPLYGPVPATPLVASSAMLIGSGVDSAGGMLDVVAIERFGAVSGSDAVTLSASTDIDRQVNGAGGTYTLRRWFGVDTLSSANVAIGTQRRFLVAIEHAGVRALAIAFALAFCAWGWALSRLRAIPFRTSGKSAAMVIGIVSALIGLRALVAIRLATQFPLDFEAALTTLRMLGLLAIGTVCLNRDLLAADTRRRGALQLIVPAILLGVAAVIATYVAEASTVDVITGLVRDGLIALTIVAGVNALFPIRSEQIRPAEGVASLTKPVSAKSMLPLYLLALPAVLPSALVELHFARRSVALNIGAAVTVIIAVLVVWKTWKARQGRNDHAGQAAANATYAIAVLAALAGGALLAVGQTVIAFRFLAGLGLLLGFVRIFAARWAPSVHAVKPTNALDLFGREPTLAIVQQFAYFLLLAVTDRGALLLWASCATAVVATALLMPDHKRMQAAALAGVLVLTAVMYVVQVVSREDAANPAIALSTAKIRFAAAHFPEALEQRIFAAPVEQAPETMNALVQIWGARAFSGAGGTTGQPYLQGPFRRDTPIESKIATTDNAFAVLVLGDHGLLGGYAVLALLVSLAALLLVAASSSLVESWRRLPEALELLVLAFFIAVPSIYLTAANVGAVSLTGQNVPFLGMRGATEALVSTVLILFIIGALLRIGRLTINEKTPADVKNYGKSRRLMRTMAVSIVLMGGLSAVVSVKAYSWVHEGRGPRAQYASSMMNRYQPRVLQDALEATFAKGESLGAGPSLRSGRQNEPTALAALDTNPGSYGASVARYVGSGKASGLVGCTRPEDLRVAAGDWTSARRSVRDLCTQVATVRAPWRGWIRESVRGDTLVLWHRRTPVLLAGDTGHTNDYCIEVTVVGQREVQKGKCGAVTSAAPVDRFTVQVGADGTARVMDGGDGVKVDGRALDVPRTIRAGSLITVRSGHPFVVDVRRGGARAFGRNINGQWTSVQRTTTDSLALVMHRALSSAWRGGTPAAFTDTVVTLSLDWTLHEEIGAAMRPLCEGSLGQGLVRFRTCAATIINAGSGALLAMPDWSNDSGLTAMRAPNQNFREHVIGSATKPLIAAAVLRSYPALGSMVVSETQDPQLVAGWNVTAPVVWEGGRTVAFTEFLQRSRNAFLQPLLFLGATAPTAAMPPFEPQPQGADSRLAINGSLVGAQRPTLALKRSGGCVVLDGERTAVGSGLRTLFDVRLRNGETSGPGLWAEGLSDRTFSLEAMRAADAEPSTVALADMKGEVRRGGCGSENSIALGLRNFGFGTYGNRWSNIKLAEAVGRIATGVAARTHVMRDSGVAQPVKRLDIRADARMSVVRALKAAVDSGTVFNGLRGTPAAQHGEWMIGKTGTIDYGMRTTKYTSMLLFAIGVPDEPSCVVAGAVWIEMDAQHGDLSEPVGLATELFGRAIYPALRRAKYLATTKAQCRR